MAKPSAAAVALENDLDGKAEEPERAAVTTAPAAIVEPSPVDPTPDAKDTPVAAKKAKAKPFVFDHVSGVLTLTDQHGTFETSLQGINPRVEWVLAAHGLASLLKGRVDKDRVLENIRAGQFGGKKRKKYPATVVAYANYQNITVEEAWTQWQALTVPERMTIRSMPKVRLELAKLADIAEAVAKT